MELARPPTADPRRMPLTRYPQAARRRRLSSISSKRARRHLARHMRGTGAPTTCMVTPREVLLDPAAILPNVLSAPKKACSSSVKAPSGTTPCKWKRWCAITLPASRAGSDTPVGIALICGTKSDSTAAAASSRSVSDATALCPEVLHSYIRPCPVGICLLWPMTWCSATQSPTRNSPPLDRSIVGHALDGVSLRARRPGWKSGVRSWRCRSLHTKNTPDRRARARRPACINVGSPRTTGDALDHHAASAPRPGRPGRRCRALRPVAWPRRAARCGNWPEPARGRLWEEPSSVARARGLEEPPSPSKSMASEACRRRTARCDCGPRASRSHAAAPVPSRPAARDSARASRLRRPMRRAWCSSRPHYFLPATMRPAPRAARVLGLPACRDEALYGVHGGDDLSHLDSCEENGVLCRQRSKMRPIGAHWILRP